MGRERQQAIILGNMYNNYDYPLGADTPDAPWNEKEPHMVKCEACDGNGYHYYAYDFEKDEEIECTEQAWCCLPETEEHARSLNQHYIQGEKETCEVCDGVGEVEYEEDYEPDYDDYYER